MLSGFRRNHIRRKIERRRSLRFGLALATIFLVWPSIVWAQFLDCREIRPDRRDQIIVGDVGLAQNADRDAAKIAVARLHQKLRAQLADLISSLGGSVWSVPCPGHSPKPSDFTEGIVQRRFDAGVLVEIWGATSGRDADINYALVPLLLPIGAPHEPDGFYDLPYNIDPRGSISDLFSDPIELRAFTELSAGVRAFIEARQQDDDERYRRAYSALCKADGLLAEASVGVEATSADWAALRNFATLTAEKARAHTILKDLGGQAPTRQPNAQNACVVAPPDRPLVVP